MGGAKMTMRKHRSLLVLAATVSLTGCYRYHQRIVPESGQRYAYATGADVTVYANAEAWNGNPHDLPRHLTPIWIEVRNHSKKPLTISYADFSLADERNFRFAAINPYAGRSGKAPPPPPGAPGGGPAEPAKPEDMKPEADPPPATPEEQPDRGSSPGPVSRIDQPEARPLLASLGPIPSAATSKTIVGRDRRVARRRRREAPTYRGPRNRGRGYRRGYRGRGFGGSGFYIYPRAGIHLHHHYNPWQGVVYYPPNYGVYVYSWGPAYYPAPPSADVQRLGLPEGVVKPGGRVSGFLYFHRASQAAHRLMLTWHARTPAGKPVTNLAVAFAVVRPY